MSKRYRELWPEQEKAKYTVRNRIRRGKMFVPCCCGRCGERFERKDLEAHHWSYRTKHHANVVWLCVPCHKIVHKELGPNWTDAPSRPDLKLSKEQPMKREYICYGTKIDGTVQFVTDMDGRVQLFNEDRMRGEVDRRGCPYTRVGFIDTLHSPRTHIIYWVRRDGIVDFARDAFGDVQLFAKVDAESLTSDGQTFAAEVGFVGILADGTVKES